MLSQPQNPELVMQHERNLKIIKTDFILKEARLFSGLQTSNV